MNPEHHHSKEGKDDYHHSKGSIISGVILITLGCLFLLDRFIPDFSFGKLWPVLLIVIGAVLLGTSIQNSSYKKKP